MDEMDILIIKEMAVDPRIGYRDLADRLGLSLNATHKRIQQMITKGIIAGFRTHLSPFLTGGSMVEFYGRSSSTDLSTTMELLGQHDCTARIISTGGQFLYIDSLVRNFEEMQTYQSFVREVGKIDDLQNLAMFTAGDPPAKDPLSKLDWKIVRALQTDCRRPFQDVAIEVGSTSKTVKRRVESMLANRLITFNIDLVLCSMGDPVSFVHAKLRPGRDGIAIGTAILNKKDPHVLGAAMSSVNPGLFIFSMWGRDLKELREAEKQLNANDDFESVYSNLYYEMRTYSTWSDELVKKRSA
ncbi:MAG: HTH-type transcriptional regulator Ptr2 [Methanomassiliicoccales archaeon PtaU1.Bin124]|nr:MAG: HTH-type transcriptional regulator Ptr2 [Methanomassiliicoccales archaeon PtaU1.Bin124]